MIIFVSFHSAAKSTQGVALKQIKNKSSLCYPLGSTFKPDPHPLPAVTPTSGRIWYVNGASGDDENGDGSEAHPWKTIRRASDDQEHVLEGDTVSISPGVYREIITFNGGESGCSGQRNVRNHVTYKSSIPGEYIIIDGSEFPRGTNGLSVQCGIEGIVFEYFEVRNWLGISPDSKHPGGQGGKGIDVYQARDTIFRNLKLHDTSHGFKETGGFNTIVDTCEVHNNGIPASNQGHGFYIQGDGTIITNCRIYQNGGVTLGTNDNPGMGIQIQSGTYEEEDRSKNMVIYNNQIYENGNGVSIDERSENIVFRNNIVYRNMGRGLRVDSRASEVKIHNNTFIDNRVSVYFLRLSDLSGISLKNNILYGRIGIFLDLGKPIDGDIGTFDYNYYWSDEGLEFVYPGIGAPRDYIDFKRWKIMTGQDRNSSIANPLLDKQFMPGDKSPVIDHGTYVGLPCSGLAPDVGAFEFGL
ncbi:MAG: right-handed parallel beta-helix repeat-containing protein [Deltaproteobacteria bacterium]|nr:right-handed parallel beta-helix repeat-containing protein [Deltaproteobacteria bacterium]